VNRTVNEQAKFISWKILAGALFLMIASNTAEAVVEDRLVEIEERLKKIEEGQQVLIEGQKQLSEEHKQLRFWIHRT